MEQKEIVYYNRGNVKVTSARAILDDNTYAMSNIASVSMEKTSANRAPWVITALVGVLVWICAASMDSRALVFVGIGALVLGIGVAAISRDKYAVVIGSASGKTHAMESPKKGIVQEIVDAMNEAIIQRG